MGCIKLEILNQQYQSGIKVCSPQKELTPIFYVLNVRRDIVLRWIDPTGMTTEDPDKLFNPNIEKYRVAESHIPEADATKYVDEKGNTLVNTNDGRTDVVVIPASNIEEFTKKVQIHDQKGDIHNTKTTEELNKLGYPISNMKNQRSLSHNYPTNNETCDAMYKGGYDKGYDKVANPKPKGNFWREFKESFRSTGSTLGATDNNDYRPTMYHDLGYTDGKQDASIGRMNKFEPKIKNNTPKIKLKTP